MKKTLPFFIFIFSTYLLLGQESNPTLHQIAHNACPCFEQIDFKMPAKEIDIAGQKCLQEAFAENLQAVMEVYGEGALEEANITKIGEEIAFILLEECTAFINYSVAVGNENSDEEAILEEIDNNIKAKMLPLVQEISRQSCDCATLAPNANSKLELESIFVDCIEKTIEKDKKLDKKLAKAFNINRVTREERDLFGQEVGVVMLKECPLFRQMVLGEAQKETIEDMTSTDNKVNHPLQGVMTKVSNDACDCFSAIEEDVIGAEASKAGRTCMENALSNNIDAMVRAYNEETLTQEEIQQQFMKDMSKSLGAELIKNCEAFSAVGERARQ